MSVVLTTGAATGTGNLAAGALAAAGHTVYACMRSVARGDAKHAQGLLDIARRGGVDLRAVELDVQSQASADAAIGTIPSATCELRHPYCRPPVPRLRRGLHGRGHSAPA